MGLVDWLGVCVDSDGMDEWMTVKAGWMRDWMISWQIGWQVDMVRG